MKKLILSLALVAPGYCLAQDRLPDLPRIDLTSEVERSDSFYNVAAGQCRMLKLYIGSVAGWRDNGVPIERVQENVQTAVSPFGLTPEVLLRWRRAVDEIYYSTQTLEQVSENYEGFCAPYERIDIPVPMPR